MAFVKKTNDTFEVIDALPNSYNMVSNYHLLDKETHIKDGFFELEPDPTLAPDEEMVNIIDNEYEFVESNKSYRKKYIIRKKTTMEKVVSAKEPSEEEKLENIRVEVLIEKFNRLSICDWVELPSTIARMSESEHQDWLDYRQKLRDCVKVDDPRNVVWPTAPYSPKLGSEYLHGHLGRQ